VGDVIGLGRKRPDGSKIVQLRKSRGLKQEALADLAGVSVRVLREVERRNHPLDTTTLTALATQLQVTADDIVLSDARLGSALDRYRLKLRAVRSANGLYGLADTAGDWQWGLLLDPEVETQQEMQELLVIVRRYVRGRGPITDDEFDDVSFGTIPRLAKLKNLVEALRTCGVHVLAGTYVFRWRDEENVVSRKTVLEVRFAPSDVEEHTIFIDPGLPASEEKFDLDDSPF
jgi:transcriptional regulator with XRE-family HTH domain